MFSAIASRRRLLALERLENRAVLAGNVTAALMNVGGVPTRQVYGDAASNSVTVRSDGLGTVEVVGSATTMNGGRRRVTFSNVARVEIDVAGGHDTVRTQSLAVQRLVVRGGAGNDSLQITGTTYVGPNFELSVHGDDSILEPITVNGEDTITVKGTTVQSEVSSVFLKGDLDDDFFHSLGLTGRRDRISVFQTSLAITGYSNFTLGEDLALEDPGNVFTLEGYQLRSAGSYLFNDPTLQGSSGAGSFSLRNLDWETVGEFQNRMFVSIYSFNTLRGNDTVDVRNVKGRATRTNPEQSDFPVNFVCLTFVGTTVKGTNIEWEGGDDSSSG